MGVKVLDLTDERGIYGAKLIADLGADVVRPEPPSGDPLRARRPLDAEGNSLWFAFFASSRRCFCVDPNAAGDIRKLRLLAAGAAVILLSKNSFASTLLDMDDLQRQNPELILIEVSSFGSDGPWKDYLAPDLVAAALGGAAATTGDETTQPLKSFGELNFILSGAYAAIAALAALYHQEETGQGQKVGVSVHECIASCLEHVFLFYWYGERMKRGRVLPRRGATHWSNAYDVFPARDGCIMATPTPDFDRQLAWLIEEGVQEDLIDPVYMEPENLPLLAVRMMEVMRKWVATRQVEPLFHEAQQRRLPYGWVLPLENLANHPQLLARDWYQEYRLGSRRLSMPGPPYRFSDTPWQLMETHSELLDALEWQETS